MNNNGYDPKFYIRRKRTAYAIQFLVYLKEENSQEATWNDAEDRDIDATNTDGILYPQGYRTDGAEYLTGNLDVASEQIREFTIAAVVTRDDMTNNDAIVYSIFGSSHYPRIYFEGENIVAEAKKGGFLHSITADTTDYMQNGKPHFIVFRGESDGTMDLLIDNEVVASS